MKPGRNRTNRPGAALLVVLFIVMAITILSLGFLSRSDVELACGENMIMRAQMDYLAESGLEHAKGLILNPQDVDTEYWTGDTAQQVASGDDYYDVEVVRNDPNRCNYFISCDAYRLRNDEQVGRSSLKAELRLDPCIAYWAGASTAISQRVTIIGDVYCNGNISGSGYIGGDGFAGGNITASVEGRKNELVTQPPVSWPGLEAGGFSSMYYIGSAPYSVDVVDSNVLQGYNFNPSAGNPAGVHYCSGDAELVSDVSIKGMLVVNGTLKVTGANNVISAVKNFPALLVNGEVIVEDGGTLEINGLAQIGQKMVVTSGAGNVDINGGLFIANGGIEGSVSSSILISITAAPAIASIQTWPGAFFRSIERK